MDDLYCFDGRRFLSLRPYGFPREFPNSIAEDTDGGIWVATQGTDSQGGSGRGGLYRYEHGHVEKIFTGDGLSVVRVAPGVMLASIGVEGQGHPTYGDLYRFSKSGSSWLAERLKRNAVNHMTVDRYGTVLFPCPGGWCELHREQAVQPLSSGVTSSFIMHADSPLIERVLRDRFGCIWFRAESFASYQCPGMSEPVKVSNQISAYDNSAHLEEAPDGSIFMLVNLALGRPGAFHIAKGRNGIPSIDTATVAHDGTIWIGGPNGLYRFMYPFRLEYWTRSDGLEAPGSVLRIDGQTFAASNGLVKLAPDRRTWIRLIGADRVGILNSLAAGPEKTLSVTSSTGVAQVGFDGRLLAKTVFSFVGTSDRIGMVRTREGTMWLGAPTGAYTIARQGHRLSLIPQDLPRETVEGINYDGNRDRLWACIGNKLFVGKPGAWQIIGKAEGLTGSECALLAVSQQGDVWMSYRTAGYALIKDLSSSRIEVRNYLEDSNRLVANSGTSLLDFDSRGWLWRDSTKLNVATAQSAEAGEWLQLDQQDGLPISSSGAVGFSKDTDGSVWLAGDYSIVHFSPPADFVVRYPLSPIFISSFSTGKGAATLADAFSHAPHDSDVVVHVGSLQFDRRNALHLRYRVVPDQPTWRQAGSLDVDLGRLHWGAHSFEVQAQMATGPWSPVVQHTFTILKPIWITWPVLLSFTGISITIGSLATTRYKRRVAREKKSLPDLAEWRLASLVPEGYELVGTCLDGRFQVQRVLARGGFATVLAGRDLQTARPCAIKVFRRELVGQPWLERQFRQEVAALESIRHPSVVQIYGHGTAPGGALYVAMEFIEGKTLREVLHNGALSPPVVADLTRQAGSALDQLHALGIYHRDLKPENIMVCDHDKSGMHLVLIDFSIAIIKNPDESIHGLSRAAGTLYYMAPEQVLGYADASSDIYSLAKILIEMLSGRPLSQLLPDASLDLSQRVPGLLERLQVPLSPQSVAVLCLALEFDPAKRPRDAGAFAKQIGDDLAAH